MFSFGTSIPGTFEESPHSPETLASYLKEVNLEEPDVEMKTVSLEDTALGQLQNDDQASLLDVIDELRGHGISKHIDLPQLIVCGDQSSGKSSLLEAITHLPFPTKDGICTTFATEVALRRSPRREIKISIIPGPSRSEADKERLKRFSATFTNPSDFPALIDDAKNCMNGSVPPNFFSDDATTTGSKSINDDVLHLDISGPNWPPLTIVDLPGLIQSEARGQTAADVRTVRRLTQAYAQNPRSVILAVVAANYDHANQAVLRLAREADPEGRRTLGIITKPDRVVVGGEDEAAVVRLAKNVEHELRLGWHVVKNRDHAMRDCSSEERDRAEKDFFAQGIWGSVLKAHVGVDALRTRLGSILLRQIRTELPILLAEIKKGIQECESGLARMGEPRETPRDQRAYLVDISKTFERLTLEAVRGSYQHEFFTKPTEEEAHGRRLRAVIQNANEEFAYVMQKYGHSNTIVDSKGSEPDIKRASFSSSELSALESSAPAPRIMPRAEYVEEIKEKVRTRRGRELPGMYNPLLVGDIFREQAAPWEGIVKEHADIIWNAALGFLETLLASLADGHTYYALLEEHIQPIMDKKRKELFAKIDELLKPYKTGHLITYHPLFSESMPRLKNKQMQDDTVLRLKLRYGPGTSPFQTSLQEILEAINNPGWDDEQGESASEVLLYCMEAFYKVALHTFIDNAATLGVECCLVSSLSDIFSPAIVSEMDDEALANLASESVETKNERSMLQERMKSLKEGEKIVGRHARQAPPQAVHRSAAPRKPTARAKHTAQTQSAPARASTPLPTYESESSSTSTSSTPSMSGSIPSGAASVLPTPASSPEGHRDTPNQVHKRNSLLEGFFAQEKPNYSYALSDDNHTNDVPKYYTEESPVTVLSTGLAGFHISNTEEH